MLLLRLRVRRFSRGALGGMRAASPLPMLGRRQFGVEIRCGPRQTTSQKGRTPEDRFGQRAASRYSQRHCPRATLPPRVPPRTASPRGLKALRGSPRALEASSFLGSLLAGESRWPGHEPQARYQAKPQRRKSAWSQRAAQRTQPRFHLGVLRRQQLPGWTGKEDRRTGRQKGAAPYLHFRNRPLGALPAFQRGHRYTVPLWGPQNWQ